MRAIPHLGDTWRATFAAWNRGIPHVSTLNEDSQSIYRNNQPKPYRHGQCNSPQAPLPGLPPLHPVPDERLSDPPGQEIDPKVYAHGFLLGGRAFVATWRAASRSRTRVAFQNPRRIPNPHCVPKSASRFRIRIAIREFIALQKRIAIGGFVAFYVAFSNCHPRGAKNCGNEIMSTFASDNPVKSIG